MKTETATNKKLAAVLMQNKNTKNKSNFNSLDVLIYGLLFGMCLIVVLNFIILIL